MSRDGLQCPECGRWTEAGLKAMRDRAKLHPIYGTDFSKTLSALIEDIRSQLSRSRGQLDDIIRACGWEDRIAPAVGGLTCVISLLHGAMVEMRTIEAAQKEAAVEPAPAGTDKA